MIDYERLKSIFSPEEIENIRTYETHYSSLPWEARQEIDLLRSYPPNTTSEDFKRANELNDHGWRFHISGRYDKALEFYGRAVELCADFSMIWNNMGLSYSRLGDFENAKSVFEKAIQLSPNYIAPYSNLGFLYLDIQENENESKNWFEKSLAFDPNYQRAKEGLERII